MNPITCVDQDDVVSLRIICTLARNKQYDLEELNDYGNTALLQACYLGRFECARILLAFGANIYAINYYGQNALTLATHAGHLQLVLELLRYRTYKDFNMSSIVPAICVAELREHRELVAYFDRLDPLASSELQTVHGFNADDIRNMVRRMRPPQPTQPKQVSKHYFR